MVKSPTPVTMFFDATCPFAWVTSRWLLEVEKVRDVATTFTPMSLSVLNEGRELDGDYKKMMQAAWSPALAAAAIHTEHPDKTSEFYTAVGTAIHNEERGNKLVVDGYDTIVAEAVEKVGLPAAFLDNVGLRPDADNAYLEQLQAMHDEGIALVGDDVGTPIIKIGGRGFFGPVLTRIPRGEIAGELFDAAVTLGNYPHFFELKRSRTEEPLPEIADS